MSAFNLGQMLQRVKDPAIRILFQNIEDAINAQAKMSGIDPVGKSDPPSPIQAVNVKAVGEYVHVSITDNNPVSRGINYFTEVDTDPSFPQPVVYHHGTSRTPPPFVLPTNNDSSQPVTYYVQSYSQYPGSNPGVKVAYGGLVPTGITLTGSTNMTLLPSTGSGTAQATGQQAGHGFGVVNRRLAPAPKRLVAL